VKPLAPVAPVAAGTHHDPSPDETAIHRVPGESVGVDTYREPVAARRARTTPTEPLPPLAPVAAGTRLEPLVPTAAERESQPRIELGEAGVRELRPAPGTAPPLALESLPFQLPPVDLPAGMVWPGVAGRAVLAALGAPVRLVPQPASWAPTAAVELVYSDGWSAHTSAELVFPAVERGRPVLFDAIRWQAKLSHLTPPGRTYALAPERDRVRLWVLTPPYRTVWAAIEEAFAHGDRATAGRLARTGLEAVDELRARGVPIADLDHIAVDDPSRLLATPWTPHRDRLIAQLQRLFAAAVL
jgi:hypothetical protein